MRYKKILTLVIALAFSLSTYSQNQSSNFYKKEIYKTVDTLELHINIFMPKKQDPSKAAVVLIHGGGWNTGSPKAMKRYAEHFSSRGLIVFTPEYRLRKKNNTTIVEAVADAKNAIAWVKSHAKEYDFDPDKLIVGGGSAGGHLAVGTVLLPDVGDENPKQDYTPSCLILFNPVLDVSKEGFGHRVVAEEVKPYGLKWQQLSPMEYIKKDLPPMLVVVGDKDKVLKKPVALKFEERMKKEGNDFTLKIYPGAEHTFFNYDYGKKQGYPKGTVNKFYFDVLQELDNYLVKQGYIESSTTIDIPENAIYPIRK
ncbi:MAG: alpha/beta hydrolase [Flavobacteriales bacterium]|nr:alpha/beta hydrolase [Flavobacteriales bacterium]